jgi:hypothetical protein
MALKLSQRILPAALALLVLRGASPTLGQAVFSNDPVDPGSGQPYTLLPGLPLVSPGADGKFNSADDTINLAITGDVDLVVRSSHAFTGGVIPAAAAGVAAAPAVVPGGLYSGAGTEADFQVIISDGAATPAAGNPQPSGDLDGRGVFVMAYADLDGDGVIGPWDGDGASDDQLELQEVYTPVGRQVAVLQSGVASGSIGVTLGAPGSAGGLAVLLVAGAATGSSAPIYLDGPWIATRLPFMPPIDAADVVGHGGGIREPNPDGLVEIKLDVEFAPEDVFLPAPGHPQLGTPYAIPTDGSSVTNDVVRSESSAAAGIGIGRAVDSASFVAVPGRRLFPIVDDGGARLVVESIDLLTLADDGPGNGVGLWVFPADLLGNAADPLAPLQVTLEVGPALRISSPDSNGDPRTEDLVFSGPQAMPIVIDDAGVAGDGASGQYLTALVGGVPSTALRADLTGSIGPLPTLLSFQATRSVVKRGRKTGKGVILVKADFTADPTQLDLATQEVELTLAAAGVVYTRTFAAGSFVAKGRAQLFQDDKSVAVGRVKFLIRGDKDPVAFHLKLKVKGLDLDAFEPQVTALTHTLRVGPTALDSAVPCAANKRATATLCAP